MSLDRKIDLVAPSFAGHLFPLLDLAMSLRAHGWTGLRLLSTSDAEEAARLCGLELVALLPGRADRVRAIADTKRRVGGNPLRLYRQLQANLALMGDLRDQLRSLWQRDRPDIVIADFTVPVAGLVARGLGIPWWTSTPSPCVIESATGTPAYLGGWSPWDAPLGRMRDALGRRVIRLFKSGVARVVGRQLKELGFDGVYREDGVSRSIRPSASSAWG